MIARLTPSVFTYRLITSPENLGSSESLIAVTKLLGEKIWAGKPIILKFMSEATPTFISSALEHFWHVALDDTFVIFRTVVFCCYIINSMQNG